MFLRGKFYAAALLLGVLPRDEMQMLQMLAAKILSKFGIKGVILRADASAA